MSHIGNVPYIPDFIAKVQKVSVKQIKDDCRARMSEVRIAVDSGAANVQSDKAGMKRLKEFFLFSKTVKEYKTVLHIKLFDLTKVR
jgi:hypothetical protein